MSEQEYILLEDIEPEPNRFFTFAICKGCGSYVQDIRQHNEWHNKTRSIV